eukprot:CAMPEP_0185021950 /NCGR_PEP_ID=MMETSP1103-20130426/4648_1 /TAXON_ID=36769 /ORGANISM="Paraphysomonas bandaiensis, Strain Caron Lab Isolate" /LENGTH=852 /DNA_ID=CAMNT_0027553771 /DNA_START=239 /DNA_END=2797 /DNA_ORIENTATION=+
MTEQYLLSAAQNMEELVLPYGSVIIRQDDVGDSFYVIQEGLVSVSRKANPSDPTEAPKELAQLGANAYIGEIALLTQEPRTATVTVISPVARILVMTKAKFDFVMQQCSAHLFSDKKEIGRGVVNKVPLFASLSSSKKKSIVESMRPMNFLPNTYICRQGSNGNTFYIIAEGHCKVTVNTGNEGEKDVTKLGPGDFFGEVALIEPSNKRTANVISVSTVSCMTLSRRDFTQLLSNVRNSLIENSAVRTLALRKVKKDSRGRSQIVKRRITGFDDNNQKSFVLVSALFRRLARSMTESLWLSLYSRFYREVTLKPDAIEQYGDVAKAIFVMNSSRDSAVAAIMNQVHSIGRSDPNDRSAAENQFMYGVLVQKNRLREKICKGWPLYQYRLLCRQIRIIRVKPLSKIVEAGTNGTSAYVILRGCVRVFSSHTSEGSGKTILKYEEDLFPGDIFAEAALDGIRARLTTVQAVTNCDLAVVEYQDYTTATIEHSQKESVDDRFQFLSKCALLRHWDGIELYRIASVMVREDVAKGSVIMKKGDISKKLCILMDGKIDVVVGLGPQQVQHVITTIKQKECFNESGILTHVAQQQTGSGPVDRSESFAETCYAVAGSHVTLLCLHESNYHLIDQSTLDKLLLAFREKNLWRIKRMDNLRTESKNINKWKKKIQFERELQDAKWHPPPRIKQVKKDIVIESLDDIPQLLDSNVDPMLAISTCRNMKEVKIVQNSIREAHRPKSARMASTRKYMSGSCTSRNLAPKRLSYKLQSDEPAAASKNESPDQEQARPQSTPLPAVNVRRSLDITEGTGSPREYLQLPSRHLMGSAHIPAAKSFCDVTKPQESAFKPWGLRENQK